MEGLEIKPNPESGVVAGGGPGQADFVSSLSYQPSQRGAVAADLAHRPQVAADLPVDPHLAPAAFVGHRHRIPMDIQPHIMLAGRHARQEPPWATPRYRSRNAPPPLRSYSV